MEIDISVISLEIGAAFFYWLVYVVIETAMLQLFNWGNFRQCLKASLLINLCSAIVVALSLMYIPRLGLTGLFIGLLLVIIIEAIVLTLLKPTSRRKNWFTAGIINLVSFIILSLPIFWFSHA